MKIRNEPAGMFRIEASLIEIEGMQQCVNEAANPDVVREFERQIGFGRSAVETLLSNMLTQTGQIQDRSQQVTIFLSRQDLHIIKNCMYEVCNGIRFFEFQLRIGIELDAAITMLRTLSEALELSLHRK